MKNVNKVEDIIRHNKKVLEKTYNIKSIGIFGSYAKGNIRKESDIDILVEFYESPDMFKFIELEHFLERLLGKKVDLVTRRALKSLIRANILKEAVYI